MDKVYQQQISVAFDFPVVFTRRVLDAANRSLVCAIDRKGGVHPHRVMAYVDGGVGSLAPGKYADIVAVEGDALADLVRFEKMGFVMKGGIVHKAP